MNQESNKSEKKDKTKIGAVIVLIISALVFIPAGGGLIFSSLANKQDVPVFGVYNGEKIEYKPGSLFSNTVSQLVNFYTRLGYNVDQSSYYYVLQEAFRQTVLYMHYENAIKESGYSVPESAINRELVSSEQFQENGKFSMRLYNQATSSEKQELKENIERSLIHQRYTDDVFGSSVTINGKTLYGIKASNAEKQFILGMDTEKHSFDLVAFNTNDFPKSEAVKFAESNKNLFVKYDLSAITLSTQEEAEEVLKQINNNELTFEDAVSEKSQGNYADSDGKVLSSYYYQLLNTVDSGDLVEQITSLSVGQISSVIKTKVGYSIFRADASAKDANLDDEDTVNVIHSYVKTNERGYVENYYMDDIAGAFALSAASSSFAEACEKEGITEVSTTAFPVNYGASTLLTGIPSDIPELEGLSSNVNAMQTLFSLKLGELSKPFVLGNNIIVATCSGIQKDNVGENDNYASTALGYDRSSASNGILSSENFTDNFLSTYMQYFLKN